MQVCVLGYFVVGLALLLFVQARNVFPQLLLARLLFSVGGAATSTMVTAILPSMILPQQREEGESQAITTPPANGHGISPSISSELTITPQRLQRHERPTNARTEKSPTQLAGIVGLFTGCGALIALAVFLRLPELMQRTGTQPGQALADSYYIVGALSLALSIICFFGLRHLRGEDGKGWSALMYEDKDASSFAGGRISALWSFSNSIMLGFKSPLLGLGYLGGFVARASSVGISLFIPLYVNAYYISSGRCDKSERNPQDIKEHCRDAYALAAELTGVSQLVALLCAPVFGFLADKYRHYNAPLLVAALVGVMGYVLLASLESPMISGEEGSPWVFVIMAFLGISQIGAIVCSLGLLGRCVLELEPETSSESKVVVGVASAQESSSITPNQTVTANQEDSIGTGNHAEEALPLLGSQETTQPRRSLKGSIAGVYSLAGGIGILILTKAGGVLFDRVSSVAPFAMLAGFNLLLLIVGIGQVVSTALRGQAKV